MKTFTIENETNNITAHATVQEAEAVTKADLSATKPAAPNSPLTGRLPAWSRSGTAYPA
jgi:hypothetical protein